MKLRNKHIYVFAVLASTIFILACEEVIDINLNTAAPRITVQAAITDQPGPYSVTLLKSESYFASNDSFPLMSNATVSISDDAGNTDALLETTPGVYKTTSIKGVNGRTYHLKIVSEGKTYEASSYLPMPVKLDSVVSSKITSTGTHSKDANKYYVKCLFKDPAGMADYYRVELTALNTDTTSSVYQIYSDEVSDGLRITYPVQQPTFNLGDTAIVMLYHINGSNYDYYKTANNILKNKKGPMASASAPQGNPLTNISGGALGYFGTYAVSKKKIVIK